MSAFSSKVAWHLLYVNYFIYRENQWTLKNSSQRAMLLSVWVLSRVWIFLNPWTIARQSPLSIGISRQEYWSGYPCPPPGDLPHREIEPTSLMSVALAGEFFTTTTTWEAHTTRCLGLNLQLKFKVDGIIFHLERCFLTWLDLGRVRHRPVTPTYSFSNSNWVSALTRMNGEGLRQKFLIREFMFQWRRQAGKGVKVRWRDTSMLQG